MHALESYQISGLKHNIEFLANIAEHPAFANADFSTDFIGRYGDTFNWYSFSEADTALPLPRCIKYLPVKKPPKRKRSTAPILLTLGSSERF